MGSDEALVARTAESAERQAGERIEQLAAERRRLDRRLRRDLADNEQALAQHRLDEVTGELSAIGDGTVDAERLRAALSAFTPVWAQLFPAEQERILRLLIEHITYDPDTGDVAIELRPCGIDALADEATETP